jgi:hypothetical protein
LVDGTIIKGLKATLKSTTDDASFEVLATAKAAGGGVMAITRFNNDSSADEKKIIDRFWATLKVGK